MRMPRLEKIMGMQGAELSQRKRISEVMERCSF